MMKMSSDMYPWLFPQMEEGREQVQLFEKRLHAKNSKLCELQELTRQFPAREESEEKLRTEISSLRSELANTQHDLATLRSHHDSNKLEELGERVEQLQNELRRRVQTCSTLQEQLNQAMASLEATRQVEAHGKTLEEQLQEQVARIQEILKQRESTLQGLFSEKERVEEHCRTLQSQIGTLKSQAENLQVEMEKSKSHVSDVCSLLEEREKEVETLSQENATLTTQLTDVQTDSKKFLHAYEKAVIQVQTLQEEKEEMALSLKRTEKELEGTVVLKAQLEDRIASLSSEMAEKEEYRELQVRNLQNSLDRMQDHLREKNVELELVKSQLQGETASEEESSEGEEEKETGEAESRQEPTGGRQHQVSWS